MTRVLVVYATRNGSTEEVARAIATVATASGAQAEVTAAASVRGPLRGWDLVVLGGAIYSGRWHADARRFLRRHRVELASVPVAVFGMGPRRDDEEAWRHSRNQLDHALRRAPWLVPVAVGLFGGVDPPRRARVERRDLRDWTAIGDWARKTLAAVAEHEESR